MTGDGFDYQILSEFKLVFIKLHGQNTMQDFVGFLQEVAQNPAVQTGSNFLVDASRAKSSRQDSQTEKSTLTKFLSRIPNIPADVPKPKVATVVGNTLEFGLTRMYTMEMMESILESRVFKSMDDALDWLELPSDVLALLDLA